MALPDHVRRLLLREQQVAAEVASSSEDLRAFVTVYPFQKSLEIDGGKRYAYLGDSELLFNARRFQVKQELIEKDYDVSEPALLDLQQIVLPDERILEVVLRVWLTDLNCLDAAWKTDIPV